MIRWSILIAGILGCVGVTIGAYAAHGLEANLAKQGLSEVDIQQRLEQCDVAVRYHMLHTLALLSLGCGLAPTRRRTAAALLFVIGIALFSGGLYSMVFLGVMGHWAIVPLGGLCFILGWLCLALTAIGKQADDQRN